MSSYPALELLLVSYFDEYWDLHYSRAWDVVLAFSIREPAAHQLSAEVTTLLRQHETEEALETTFCSPWALATTHTRMAGGYESG